MIPSFDEYLATLSAQSSHPDPTLESKYGLELKSAASELSLMHPVSKESLTEWISTRPQYIEALGISVGLSKEKLTNNLAKGLGTAGYVKLSKERSADLISFLDNSFDLVALLNGQLSRDYNFGDVLAARAGTRAFAKRASEAGRNLEDMIEEIAKTLGLPYALRGTFIGRDGREAPFDLAIPAKGEDAQIVVAAKGFDSTGSKLGDAVREIESMASARRPSQYVMAVIDGIGWNRRKADLARIHSKWVSHGIDGMYTRATLTDFQHDLEVAARIRGLL